jgi:hypothetical protein
MSQKRRKELGIKEMKNLQIEMRNFIKLVENENFDHQEYNDEAGMAHSNLHTLDRAVKGLIDAIKDDDNLPEWCQEKIAKSKQMLVGVWDYILSQKEQGIDPKI